MTTYATCMTAWLSIKSYFKAQSSGKFVPEYDVVGPVALPHDMAYYRLDERATELMIDACKAADTESGVDFSQYDFNGDGKVDFVFVVYASSRPPQSNLPQDFFITNASKCLCRWSFYLGSRPPQSNLPQDFFITNASKCLCRWSFYLVLPFFSAPLPHPDFGNGIVTQFRFKLAFGRFYLALAKIVRTS